MVKRGVFVVLAAVMAAGLNPAAMAQTGKDAVFSPQTASVFVKTAQEIFRQDAADAEPAMRFLEAAAAMDRNSAQIPEQLLRIGTGSCGGTSDSSEAINAAMGTYISRQSDLEVVFGAIRCLMTTLNVRQDREALLERLLRRYAAANAVLGSELATQLGLLAAEKADAAGARDRLNYAYQLNPYNSIAFDKLVDLYAAEGMSVGPEAYSIHLRTMLDANPYDLSAVLRYADILRQLEMYAEASGMYEYADRVFAYRFPDRTSGQSIYLPWMLSCYRSPRQYSQCLDLADKFRSSVAFDLMLEAVAGRAAAKMGRPDQARTILEQAAQKAEQMLGQTDLALPIYPEHLAWFFSFVLERPDNALAWSNQAFSQAPDRRGVRSIFAYTLAMNGQYDVAQQYAESLAKTDQVAAITMALVRRQEDARQIAIELLREAIALAPDTFEAEKARAILTDLGSEYIMSPAVQAVQKALEEKFGARVALTYLEPRQRFSAKMLFSGSDIFYGGDLDPRLVIENNSSAPMVIQDGAMLAGMIRVNVAVRGDLTMDIPDLLSMRIRPSRPIMPNEHIFIPLDMQTGKLRRLLMTYPQASLELEFTVYLDPIANEDGTVVNALKGTSPIRAAVRRRGASLTREFMMQRLDALAKGQEGQKIQAAQLFVGLLAEQEAFRLGQAQYAYTQVESSLLVDAVRRALTDENWRLRVHTMAAIDALSLPTDYALIQTLSSNLNHDRWPVRFMSLYLLKNLQKGAFQQVLDWTAQYDSNNLNRRLAVALGGKQPPQPQREPISLTNID